MTSLTNPLILVDGSSYLFRAYHALPPLTNSKGEATGAMHGVLNMLDRLRKDYQPDYMVVVFDASGKTFRDDIFPDYKANRPPMPDDLRAQIQPLLDIIRAQGYPLLQIPDVEADDVIGTLATRFQGDVLISTSDKDMAQLVTERVHLINTMSETYLDIEGVQEKFGILPEQIRDYLSLVGDSVDNVPGVDKVGPKTAVKWLAEYGSLQGVMDNADKIKGKVGENLRLALAHLPLTYQLVTIKCDVEVDDSPAALSIQAEDPQALRELYTRYEFRTRLSTLNKAEAKAAKPATTPTNNPAEAQHTLAPFPLILELVDQNTPELHPTPTIDIGSAHYSTVLTSADFDTLLEQIQSAPLLAFDTETTSLNALDAELVGISMATQAGIAAYIPLTHDYLGAPEQLKREAVLAKLKPLLEDPQYLKVGQNLKYDFTVLQNYGITLQGIAHDTMLESYVLDATARHDMDTLAEKVLDYKTIRFEDIAGKGKKQLTFNQIDLAQAAPYAAEDADITLRLHQQLWPKIANEPTFRQVYQSLEMPLIPVLARMERHGVKIDTLLLSDQSQELTKRIEEITEQAFQMAGQEFNLSSPKQLQEILFDKLQIPLTGVRKTPTGQPSTAEDVLEELAEQGYELPRVILEHRTLSKLKSTYTDKLPAQINPRTGRVHTSYHQTGTVTGRLSSSDPNLQNIPIRSAEGRRIRQAFIADKGCKLVAADYSQIELRIMAHLSGDEGLLQAFQAGADIHKATAAEVFHTPLEEVTSEQRRAAKAINFGLIYGMSAFGLARQLDIGRSEAQQYVDLYFARYPGVKQYMDNTRERARTLGYVETLFGRRLPLSDINSRKATQRQYAERTAINAPMQGTAADIMKKAMIAVDNYLQTTQSPIRMIMQVHDELVFEVPDELVHTFKAVLAPLMTDVVTLKIPLVVDIGEGMNWDEAH
ncbi:DNA polymerase I [Thiofilum flexile]|uniref:DNA polymerase I n=1 Tax=Thiofilum flexile TaxID=125627 RepID=UPI000369DB80|nr:DNA polymerase I [Thiofilum flexile]